MSKLDDFINNFFDKIKKKQADRIIKDVNKKHPELAKKLDDIKEASDELAEYIRTHPVK